jgi:hypothetical protein
VNGLGVGDFEWLTRMSSYILKVKRKKTAVLISVNLSMELKSENGWFS